MEVCAKCKKVVISQYRLPNTLAPAPIVTRSPMVG